MDQNEMSAERVITVIGIGKGSFQPDTVRLNLVLTDLCPSHAEAHSAWESVNASLLDALERVGIERGRVITTSFSIDPRLEMRDEDEPLSIAAVCFEYRHTLTLTLKCAEHALLADVIEALAGIGSRLHTDISYELSDREAVTSSLIAKAVADAIAKADIIARAAMLERGEILDIDYGGSDGGGVMLLRSRSMGTNDITPRSIELSESVTVRFKIA